MRCACNWHAVINEWLMDVDQCKNASKSSFWILADVHTQELLFMQLSHNSKCLLVHLALRFKGRSSSGSPNSFFFNLPSKPCHVTAFDIDVCKLKGLPLSKTFCFQAFHFRTGETFLDYLCLGEWPIEQFLFDRCPICIHQCPSWRSWRNGMGVETYAGLGPADSCYKSGTTRPSHL